MYVSDPVPRLGQDVRVRVRVPRSSGYVGVRLRSTDDAEFRIVPARRILSTPWEDWYEAGLRIANPLTLYRFMLLRKDGSFDWLTAMGVVDRETGDSADFRATVFPAAPRWETAGAVYQVFPDRLARSSDSAGRSAPSWAIPTPWGAPPLAQGPDSGRQWYGGDLKGVEDHLDHVRGLGFSVIYLTPFFTAGSVHRYDASTFEHVDPLLGGDRALASLARACHERGMRLMGDLTLNHTGIGHDWFRRAAGNPDSVERDFYMWRHWPGDYVSWRGVRSLPKLDWRSDALLDRLVRGPGSIAARWLGRDGLDGWRIDVANQVGRCGDIDVNHRVATAMRSTIDAALDGEGALVAEYMHQDPVGDLQGDGWQASMNYGGFSRPVWTWLCDPDSDIDYMEAGVPFRRRSGASMVATLREAVARVPWKVATAQWNILGSHDTARVRTIIGDDRLLDVAVGILVTYPGVPMVFAGDERDAEGSTGEGARFCMDWDAPEGRHARAMARYGELLRLRRDHPALTLGGMRWAAVSDDAVAFLRETRDERLLVVAARSGGVSLSIDRAFVGDGEPRRLQGDGKLSHVDDGWSWTSDAPVFGVWSLPELRTPGW